MNTLDDSISNAVFKINTSKGSGTGFFLNDRGIFVTNYHVVEGFKIVSVEDQNKERYIANVIFVNPETDIAFLKAELEMKTPVIKFNEIGNLQCRDKVFVLGFPFGMPYTVTKGIVSSTKQVMNDRNYIQTDAAVNPGNSGGPVIDAEGKLIGVTTAKFMDADNVGFAIPLDVVKEELKSLEANIEFKYSFKCNSCKTLIYKKEEYCNNCGSEIDEILFDEVPISKLSTFVEEAIQELGMNPILARAGEEYWEFHHGTSLIRIFIYQRAYLLVSSPLNELPSDDLNELYQFLLKDPIPPYQLGILNNQIYLSYRVYLADIFSSKSDDVKKQLTDLPIVANEMDDFFKDNYNCPKSVYAKEQSLVSSHKKPVKKSL